MRCESAGLLDQRVIDFNETSLKEELKSRKLKSRRAEEFGNASFDSSTLRLSTLRLRGRFHVQVHQKLNSRCIDLLG